MAITVSTNVRGVQGALRKIWADQLPFAASKAINETAKDFQTDQRAHMDRIWTVRRRAWVHRAVKIKPWASKRSLYAEVAIDPPGGQARADILSKFERQTRKRPREGERLAVPVEVRRTKTGVVPRGLRPKAFGFRPVPGSTSVMVGAQRTVLIRRSGGTGGIFQRVGRRASSRLRLLYALRPEVPISPELHFRRNARATVDRVFADHMREAFRGAIRSAR